MARNVEIEARIDDPRAFLKLANLVADGEPVEISQDDTFFHCPNGRLKLRELSPAEGQLIFYQRDDASGPKESRYLISTTSDPAILRNTLACALGCAVKGGAFLQVKDLPRQLAVQPRSYGWAASG